MKTETDSRLREGDILKSRLREMRKPSMPDGLEDSIMLTVRARAGRIRKIRVLWQLLAAAGIAAAIFGIVWAVFRYLEIDLFSTFSFIPEFFNGISESIKDKAPEAPSASAQIAGGVVLVAIFYLSVNGIVAGYARRKALRKEVEERD